MTTAKYYTPNHRTIHENGVVPNIVAPLTPSQEKGLGDWLSRDTMPPDERKRAEKFQDPQLTRAVDAMKGALVYANLKDEPKLVSAENSAADKQQPVPADRDDTSPEEEKGQETESDRAE